MLATNNSVLKLEQRIARLEAHVEAELNKQYFKRKPISTFKNSNNRLVDCIKGKRFKSIAVIQEQTGLTQQSCNTYLKLSRKDGWVIDKRKSQSGQTEYRILEKEQLHD